VLSLVDIDMQYKCLKKAENDAYNYKKIQEKTKKQKARGCALVSTFSFFARSTHHKK